jgi:hypothetical protein
MVTELNPIIDFLNYITKPENLHLLLTIIGIIVTTLTTIGLKIIMYLLKRRHIPKLSFDGQWKEPNCKGKNTCYYIKVKRNKGEGKVECVEGIVGIKDKELKRSEWLKSKSEFTDIIDYDYLLIFQTFDYKGNEIIFFPENIFADFQQSYENNLLNQYRKSEIEIKVEAKNARIGKRELTKKIDDIINKAKPIPM